MSGWTSLLVVGAGVLALGVVLLRIVRRPRRGDALRIYLRHFDAQGVPDDVSLKIFHHLGRWMSESGGGYPVLPSDRLSIYGIAPGDVGDTLAILSHECGRQCPVAAAGTISTVDDLVRAIANAPRTAQSEPAESAPSR